jgi:hypothetical protein
MCASDVDAVQFRTRVSQACTFLPLPSMQYRISITPRHAARTAVSRSATNRATAVMRLSLAAVELLAGRAVAPDVPRYTVGPVRSTMAPISSRQTTRVLLFLDSRPSCHRVADQTSTTTAVVRCRSTRGRRYCASMLAQEALTLTYVTTFTGECTWARRLSSSRCSACHCPEIWAGKDDEA